MAGNITSRADKFTREAEKGLSIPFTTITNTSNNTNATQTSGFVNVFFKFNALGTTLPSTLQGIPLPQGTGQLRLSTIVGASGTQIQQHYLGYMYRLGSQVLTATGDQFTHDAATFPVTRTVMGQTQAVELWPLLRITTATATTAAVLTLKTAAGGAGYKDQDGNNTVGVLTHTMPAVATAVNSGYMFRLEPGDSGVQDIIAIQTNTAASAGAADVWGFEPLAPLPIRTLGSVGSYDATFGGLSLPNLRPAVATSGSATAHLAILSFSAASSNQVNVMGMMTVVPD